MQNVLPAGKQVVEADADGHATIDAGHTDDRFNGLAAMRIGAIGAGEYHELRAGDRCGPRQFRVDLSLQVSEHERAVKDDTECHRVNQQ
ncbi:MAG: hypothetical protein ACLPKW_35420 [Acetobacteraceae bacterium]